METEETNTPNSALERYFEFKSREPELYKTWEEAGVFKLESAADKSAPVFNIAMPPPNANGELHLGHSYGYTFMDIFGRFHRLTGKRVCLLPGKDHAGIQTQVVFEKKLKAEGKDLQSISVENLYRSCYDFCLDRANYMRAQEKRLGLSADWSKELFTLDPRLSEIVFDTFKRLWKDGLVYRGTRIINWSVFSQTAISDIEVEYVEAAGNLWYLRYPFAEKVSPPKFEEVSLPAEVLWLQGEGETKLIFVKDEKFKAKPGQSVTTSDGSARYLLREVKRDSYNLEELFEKLKLQVTRKEREAFFGPGEQVEFTLLKALPIFDIAAGLITATTRPETMLGDAAMAVHPDDLRYQALIGKKVKLPLTSREIPIIADQRADPNYGTGVIKVTPAHDFLDYDIGKDHKLELYQVIGKDGRMTDVAGKNYQGIETEACRVKVIKDLEAEGLLLDTRAIKHKVPVGERGKDVIEPLVSEQWFVNVDKPGKSLKGRALEYVRAGKIKIYPARFQVLFEQWLENLRDWNISRQLWWGHRMPVWYRTKGKEQEIHVGTEPPDKTGWTQENDTFDTWFSSGQWAFSTFAAHGLVDLENLKNNPHVPSHTMVMGRDILFFWACRMLLLTVYRLDQVPWKNIYFSGLIRDEHGQKMSKSKGNGIEPNEIIDKYGADALRLGLIMGSSPGNDLNLSERKIEGYSKFINKLWNAGKLIELKVAGLKVSGGDLPQNTQLASSRWILAELNRLHANVTQKMEEYEVSIAADELYNFTWTTFCDWYLEMIKVLIDEGTPAEKEEVAQVGVFVYRTLLLMLHPFIPFVTEEIFQKLPFFKGSGLLAQSKWTWPAALKTNAADREAVAEVLGAVSAVRSVKAALAIPQKRIRAAHPSKLSPEATRLVSGLARVDLVAESEIPANLALRKPYAGGVIISEVEGKDQYRKRLEKDLNSYRGRIKGIEGKLSGDFAAKARPEVIQKERAELESASKAVAELERELSEMK